MNASQDTVLHVAMSNILPHLRAADFQSNPQSIDEVRQSAVLAELHAWATGQKELIISLQTVNAIYSQTAVHEPTRNQTYQTCLY